MCALVAVKVQQRHIDFQRSLMVRTSSSSSVVFRKRVTKWSKVCRRCKVAKEKKNPNVVETRRLKPSNKQEQTRNREDRRETTHMFLILQVLECTQTPRHSAHLRRVVVSFPHNEWIKRWLSQEQATGRPLLRAADRSLACVSAVALFLCSCWRHQGRGFYYIWKRVEPEKDAVGTSPGGSPDPEKQDHKLKFIMTALSLLDSNHELLLLLLVELFRFQYLKGRKMYGCSYEGFGQTLLVKTVSMS